MTADSTGLLTARDIRSIEGRDHAASLNLLS